MHANSIQEHQALTQQANELVTTWAGTDPMMSEDDVRRALVAADTPAEELDALLPYVVDACRGRGLLVQCAVCGRFGHHATDLGSFGQVCPVNRRRYDL